VRRTADRQEGRVGEPVESGAQLRVGGAVGSGSSAAWVEGAQHLGGCHHTSGPAAAMSRLRG